MMLPCRHSRHVLENERAGSQFTNKANKVEDELVAWIFEYAMTNQAEPLARGAANESVNGAPTNTCGTADLVACHFGNAPAEHSGIGKIELVCRGVDRVILDRSDHVKTGLLHSKGEPTGTRKQVYSDWAIRNGHATPELDQREPETVASARGQRPNV